MRRKTPAGGAETALVFSTDASRAPRPAPAPASALDPRASQARLRLDRRGSGRVVTLVSGIRGHRDAIDALGRELKAACGAGGTVKDGVIEIQGDHRDTVERALAARGFASKRSGG